MHCKGAVMPIGRFCFCSKVLVLLTLVCGIKSARKTSPVNKGTSFAAPHELYLASHLNDTGNITELLSWLSKTSRHLGPKRYTDCHHKRRFYSRKVLYYTNSCAVHGIELIRAGDIELNPGEVKNPCSMCERPVARNHRAILCSTCKLQCHIRCRSVTPATFHKIYSNPHYVWICPKCTIKTLPFANIEDTEFLGLIKEGQASHQNRNDVGSGRDDYLKDMVCKITSSSKNRKVAHLNIRGLRNKIDELKILLQLCRFNIFAVTESHLHNEIADGKITIEDYSHVRKDRTNKQGGGCIVYYRKSLKVLRRMDLEDQDIEMICLQVKTDSRDTLIGTVYRPPDNCDFFIVFPRSLEKVWMKFTNIVLVGDFNCNLLKNSQGELPHDGNRLTRIFQQFSMSNVIEGPTRVTSHSKTLIDLIVSTRKDLVKLRGTCPLGISDHDMIYATLLVSAPRAPPKIIKARNFKKFDETKFRRDIENTPFHVCNTFEDPSDVYHAWNLLFTNICNEQAPFRETKVRSHTLPWITKDIRMLINQRYKTLRRARKENNLNLWDQYKQLR